MDKMEQIYACVRDRDRSKNVLLATVTEGAAAGEKAYVEDGTIQIQKGTFFTGENEKNLQGKGLMKINGQEVFLQPLGNQSKLIICGAPTAKRNFPLYRLCIIPIAFRHWMLHLE